MVSLSNLPQRCPEHTVKKTMWLKQSTMWICHSQQEENATEASKKAWSGAETVVRCSSAAGSQRAGCGAATAASSEPAASQPTAGTSTAARHNHPANQQHIGCENSEPLCKSTAGGQVPHLCLIC